MTPNRPKAWNFQINWICSHCGETHNHEFDLWDLDVRTEISYGMFEETHVELDLECMNPACGKPARISR